VCTAECLLFVPLSSRLAYCVGVRVTGHVSSFCVATAAATHLDITCGGMGRFGYICGPFCTWHWAVLVVSRGRFGLNGPFWSCNGAVLVLMGHFGHAMGPFWRKAVFVVSQTGDILLKICLCHCHLVTIPLAYEATNSLLPHTAHNKFYLLNYTNRPSFKLVSRPICYVTASSANASWFLTSIADRRFCNTFT